MSFVFSKKHDRASQRRFACLLGESWGWNYLSTILDDFSRYVVAWKLCPTMKTSDVTDTLELALQASGCDQVAVRHKPRLLSDNGASNVSTELADWLNDQGMDHVRGAPYHPQTKARSIAGIKPSRTAFYWRTTFCQVISTPASNASSPITITTAIKPLKTNKQMSQFRL